MTHLATVGAIALLCLSACADGSPPPTQGDATDFLSRLANTATADLDKAISEAQAASPPDTAGVNCLNALKQEQANIQKFYVAAKGPGGGVFSAAEIATILSPGSQQMDLANQTIITGCGVKFAEIQTTQLYGALATAFKLAAVVK